MNLRQNTKRIVTAALAVWMSGIVLVVCCQMPKACADAMSCPLAAKGDCGKSIQENAGESFGRESQSFDCCVFPAKVFDKARKIEVQPPTALISAAVEIVVPRMFNVRQTFQTARVYQSFIRNRGSTHLNNRVFRI